MWQCPKCWRVYKRLERHHFETRIRCVCGRVAESWDEGHRAGVPHGTLAEAGAGTELTALFAALGITEKVGCDCKAVAAEMDRAGVAGCRERREYFLGRLGENAAKYSWWEKLKAVPAVLGAGAASLGGLFDEACRRAEAKDAWRPVRHCVYHVAPLMSNDIWRVNVRQLLKRADIFTGRRVAAIATGPECHEPAIVREAFAGSGFEFIEVPNDPQLREVASFVPLLRQVEHEPGVTFYAHTKGNSTALNVKGATRWRNAMYHYLLSDFEPVRRALTGHTFCGTTKMTWSGLPPYPTRLKVGNWMLAGTFFWFRNEVFDVPGWWELPADRYAAEAWPSMICDEPDAWSLYQPWPASEKRPNPYDPKLYPAEFDDE